MIRLAETSRSQAHRRPSRGATPVVELSIQFIARQATPPAFTEDIQHRFGVLHCAYLAVCECPVT
jgi:hypothetical protein